MKKGVSATAIWEETVCGTEGEKYVLASSCAVGHAVDGSAFNILGLSAWGKLGQGREIVIRKWGTTCQHVRSAW